ncbi:hypothetical protein [Xenorhabdus siamensis]|uniref:hypothetical protein n=1 Tax=Xenorhabdus siamensis TaxID=3136254 RepID=UPI0030F45A37
MHLLVTNNERESFDDRRFSFESVSAPRSLTNTQGMQQTAGYIAFEERGVHTHPRWKKGEGNDGDKSVYCSYWSGLGR